VTWKRVHEINPDIPFKDLMLFGWVGEWEGEFLCTEDMAYASQSEVQPAT
jgi:hypothetical protein